MTEKQINFDNKDGAINGLIQFKHNWCMNVAETDRRNDLTFRCEECQFSHKDGFCSVNIFINKHGTKEQKRNARIMV